MDNRPCFSMCWGHWKVNVFWYLFFVYKNTESKNGKMLKTTKCQKTFDIEPWTVHNINTHISSNGPHSMKKALNLRLSVMTYCTAVIPSKEMIVIYY